VLVVDGAFRASSIALLLSKMVLTTDFTDFTDRLETKHDSWTRALLRHSSSVQQPAERRTRPFKSVKSVVLLARPAGRVTEVKSPFVLQWSKSLFFRAQIQTPELARESHEW